ncbi:MAG: CRTAC1 family protein [Proteobacteria bacterium]|nr:CRTAC1 family protein [Pseudomonadota bacterium]
MKNTKTLNWFSSYTWCFPRFLVSCILVSVGAGVVHADGGVTFEDIADAGGAGIAFENVPSKNDSIARAFQVRGTVTMDDFIGNYPIKFKGAPGVALLDYDNDGDLDIYVTNGLGADNGLFANQLRDSGQITFVDVTGAAGVGLSDQESTGVCYGDIDNDGDQDLYVLGMSEPNRLLENNGNGTFTDISASSGTGGGNMSAMTCSMGDVNGDGLLDIMVANNFDMASNLAIFAVPFALNELNQLFVNNGNNVFTEVAAASGLHDFPEITWSTAMVDLDQDGDTDIVTASDNAGIPFAKFGGVDRGFVRFFANDGSGNFTDGTAGELIKPGDWMGLAFGDLDSNGTLDVFASNTGDYFEPFFGIPADLGDQASQWFLQEPDGSFIDPGAGDLVASVFGWGCAAFDYDNDGDTDIVYYGGLDSGPIVDLSNPGVVLQNDGAANFTLDQAALPDGVAANHKLRVEHGLAIGDLNDDGFMDIVSISNFNIPPSNPPAVPTLYTAAAPNLIYGSVFDNLALFFPTFLADPPPPAPAERFIFSGVDFDNGTLSVEINSADNGNRWVKVKTLGTIDITSNGVVNRDGIGAVVKFTPRRGNTAIKPVLGGSSYASQHSLEIGFGLGSAKTGTVEVLWPGGVRNRLYNVYRGERIVMPEIPCSFNAKWNRFRAYLSCVKGALNELRAARKISKIMYVRLLLSAIKAFHQERQSKRRSSRP